MSKVRLKNNTFSQKRRRRLDWKTTLFSQKRRRLDWKTTLFLKDVVDALGQIRDPFWTSMGTNTIPSEPPGGEVSSMDFPSCIVYSICWKEKKNSYMEMSWEGWDVNAGIN